MALRCCHTTYTEEKERRHSESQKVTGRRNIKHTGFMWKAGKVEEVKVSGKENQRGTKTLHILPTLSQAIPSMKYTTSNCTFYAVHYQQLP